MIQKICVCGAGTMGSGIAQLAAQTGFPVILYEVNASVLEKAVHGIEKSLQSLVDKGRIDAAKKETIFQNIQFTSNINDCIAPFFIEAVVEKPEIKIALFNQLAALNTGDYILASNTSSLSLGSIAGMIRNPERLIGMHFFNPATIMKLVEIVKTTYSSDATIAVVSELARQMGKTPVVCKDAPGFIVNRVARPFYIESLRLAEQGIAIELLDELLEASGFKMGPFKLMDLIGNDVNYAVSCSVYEQLGQPTRLKPSFIQEKKVMIGELGRKSGKGYYTY